MGMEIGIVEIIGAVIAVLAAEWILSGKEEA